MLQRVTLLISLLLAVLSGYSARAAAEAIWIDVRSAEEYAAEYVPGAINVPYDAIGERIDEVTADRDQVIYLYCGSGKRAGMAQHALLELGYTEVVNIGGVEQARKARAAVEE
jgi:phage shock protein E